MKLIGRKNFIAVWGMKDRLFSVKEMARERRWQMEKLL